MTSGASATSGSGREMLLLNLYGMGLMQAINLAAQVVIDLGIRIAAVYMFIALADFAYHSASELMEKIFLNPFSGLILLNFGIRGLKVGSHLTCIISLTKATTKPILFLKK